MINSEFTFFPSTSTMRIFKCDYFFKNKLSKITFITITFKVHGTAEFILVAYMSQVLKLGQAFEGENGNGFLVRI